MCELIAGVGDSASPNSARRISRSKWSKPSLTLSRNVFLGSGYQMLRPLYDVLPVNLYLRFSL